MLADRYTYVPLTGIFLIVVWEIAARISGLRNGTAILGIGAAAVTVGLAICTVANVHYWRASIPLFEHAVRVTRNNYIAYRVLGIASQDEGNLRRAEQQYRESLRIDPGRAPTHRLLGSALFHEGNSQAALEEYSVALKLNPKDSLTHEQLAELLLHSPDARFRNPRKGLEQARLACELSRYRRRDLVSFLARACAENHEARQASDAARKTLALSVGPREIQDAMELTADISRLAAITK